MTSDLVTRYFLRSPQENVSECGKGILESSPDLFCFRSSPKSPKQNNDIKETMSHLHINWLSKGKEDSYKKLVAKNHSSHDHATDVERECKRK